MAQLKSTNIIGNLAVTGNILTELVKTKQLEIGDHFLPGADITYDIGASGTRWNNIYAKTFNGELNGNATNATSAVTAGSATKATQDGSGNTITSYYCTLSTTQTISGAKTFTANPLIKGSNPYLGFVNSSGTTKAYLQYFENGDGNYCALGSIAAKSLQIDASGNVTLPASTTFTPRTTNTGSIGSSSFKWNAMYATTFNGDLSGNASTATSAVSASKDAKGNVIDTYYCTLSTAQTLTGTKTISNGKYYASLSFKPSNGSQRLGNIYVFGGDSKSTNIENSYFAFRSYSYSANSTTVSDNYDQYNLPATTAGKTTNSSYSILTSKNAVTVAQGGTGAANAADARTNLGVPSTTGSGASGTWAINISGNASTATSATSATTATGLTSSIAFTPAESALTPDDVYTLIGSGGKIKRGTWSYAGNGHIAKGTTTASQCPFGAIDLAGTAVIQAGNGGTQYTQLYITPPTASATDAIKGEMIYYINNGSGYSPTWYRVLTDKNYDSYVVKLDGSNVTSGKTWGISINGNAATATTAVKASQDGNGNVIHSTYLKLDGGTMNDEKSIGFQITRKKNGGGGWAYDPIWVKGNDGNIFAKIGVYGNANAMSYMYIGAGEYNDTTNFRIASSGAITIMGKATLEYVASTESLDFKFA